MSKLTKRVVSFLAITALLLGMMPTSMVARAEEGDAAKKTILTFSQAYDKTNIPGEFREGDLSVSLVSTAGKITTDDNSGSICKFGTAESADEYTYRLKVNGKTDSKTGLSISVPAKGTLTIAVRNGNKTDAARTLTLTQNENTLFSSVVKDADAVDGVFPYVVVEVEAGDINVALTGGMNFYAFIFEPATEAKVTPTATEETTPEVTPTEEPTPEVTPTEEPTPEVTPVVTDDNHTYDFRDGSIVPTDTTGKNDITYGNLTIKASAKATYSYNGAQHGVNFVPGNVFSIKVSGPVKVQIGACQYTNTKSYTLVSADGSYSETQTWDNTCGYVEFTYAKEEATTLSFELASGSTYIPYITVSQYEIPAVTPTEEPTPEVTPTEEPTPEVTPTEEPTPEVTPTEEPIPTQPTYEADGNTPADGTVVAFDVANIDPTKIDGIKDKLVVTEGIVFDDFVTVIGTTNTYRYKDADGVYAIETGKNATGKLSFKLEGVATVVISISSNGGTNVSDFVIADKDGNVLKNTANAATITGATMTEFTYINVPAGEYTLYSPTDGSYTNRGVRVSKIVATYGATEVTEPTTTPTPSVTAEPTTTPAPSATAEPTTTPEASQTDILEANFMTDEALVALIKGGQHGFTYGCFTFKMGDQNAWGYNGAQHGVEFKAGNSIEIAVTGDAMIELGDCQYSNMTEITLKSADGKYTETLSTKTGCYHNDKSELVFNYEGGATTLILEFTGKAYVPVIKVTPQKAAAPETTADFMTDADLVALIKGGQHEFTFGALTFKMGNQNAWGYNGAQHGVEFKAGNSIEIAVTGATMIELGDCLYSNMTEITLKSADGKYTETHSTKTGCYHNDKSELIFSYEGEATTLILEFTGKAYVPYIKVVPQADTEPTNGSSYGSAAYYDFQNKGEFTAKDKDNRLTGSFTYSDGLLTITSDGKAYYDAKTTGIRLGNNDTISIKVPGDSFVTLLLPADSTKVEGKWVASCEHPLGKIVCLSDSNATVSSGISGLACVFQYTGKETTLTFKVTGIETETGLAGCLGVIVSNQLKNKNQNAGNGKVDVFDFGAEALDTEKYNNLLDKDIINGFYPAGTVGSDGKLDGKPLPTFVTKDIVFSAGGNTNNRLRTKNTALIRYDAKSLDIKDADGTVIKSYQGYVYSNSSSNASVFLGVVLYPGDKLTIMASSNGNDSTIVCEAPDGSKQSYTTKGNAATEMVFYASEFGMYRLYSTNEKLVVARMEREHADAVTVNGTVTGDKLPSGEYTIIYKNDLSGEKIEVKPENNKYSVVLRKGYTYTVSIVGANGFVVAADSASYEATEAKDENLNVEKVSTHIVTGKINGLSDAAFGKLTIKFVNADKLYVPEITINADKTFTAEVEENVEYTIVAEGVNDYSIIGQTTVKADKDATQDISLELKATYKVNLTTSGVSEATWANAIITFTNLNEAGYVYSFKSTDAIALRDGKYSVKVTGVGTEVAQKLTANAIINGADSSLKINFETLTSWNPAKLNKEFGGAGVESIGEGKYYAGLILSGSVAENKTYLLVNADGTVKVPVKKGQMVTLSYCYCAGFSVDGYDVKVDEKSGKTSQIDKTSVIAKEDGFITIVGVKGEVSSQTYFTSIEVSDVIEYTAEVTVGTDKQFTTINAALDYVRRMNRTADQRVTILVDPGNYEEMLVIDIPNLSIKNAAGNRASTDLTNKGVDIAMNAVRITSYYLHGYYYYSMGSDCKYDAELLEVNKANGEYTVKNPGSGTTNGSYWNATVVIMAGGFEADGIIFENSANQYISLKESQDIIVAGTGNKGVRPTTYGDTSVQDKKFVERAAALAIGDSCKEVKFTNCRFVGRQDTLYGGTGSTVAFENCKVMGACDYIFGAMTAVFYKCDLVMNTSDVSSDVAYITAAQQKSGRGYLMLDCHITSTTPGVDTASKYASKPGYLGRPWQAGTAEVVFYNTIIDASDDYYGQDSLINPIGWLSTLSGTSEYCYEFGTKEEAFYDNQKYRVSWSNVLEEPKLKDGTDISTEEKAIEAFLGDWKAFN